MCQENDGDCLLCLYSFLSFFFNCWLEITIRNTLRPAFQTQIFLGVPIFLRTFSDSSQIPSANTTYVFSCRPPYLNSSKLIPFHSRPTNCVSKSHILKLIGKSNFRVSYLRSLFTILSPSLSCNSRYEDKHAEVWIPSYIVMQPPSKKI